MYEQLKERIKEHEGFVPRIYKDSLGFATIGYGHLVKEGEQWEDYQAGVVFGWKLNKSIGVFFEGEYTKFWDSKIYNGSVGLNITLK